ncbi:MAG: MBL fold metallo-hydrolase [Gemmatimonadaceae bacterium]
MALRLRFWGTRGSVPSPGALTVRYGGNTPCLEVRVPTGELLIFDAGTGIRALGQSLMTRSNGEPVSGDILVSHAHWDHIQGLPFFAPLYERGNRFTIWSSGALIRTVERAVREQMSLGVFPVEFEELASVVKFRSLDDGLHHPGMRFDVQTIDVRHPGGALGYRVVDRNEPDRALVYISDNELGESMRYESVAGWRDELVAFAGGAAVLVHDATYTSEEYERHRGWGHSSLEDVLALALDARVGRLVLHHHKPERTDAGVDECVAACRAMARQRGSPLEIVAAAEGMELLV